MTAPVDTFLCEESKSLTGQSRCYSHTLVGLFLRWSLSLTTGSQDGI